MKDAILTGEIEDSVLASLLELAMHSVLTGRPLFSSPLEEPAFYRKYFTPWVREGLDEIKRERARPETNPGG